MTIEEIRQKVMSAISDVHRNAGHEVPALSGGTNPIGDLDEFDSNSGLALTSALAADYQINVPVDENLFVNDEEKTARTIDEIVARIAELLEEQKGAK